MLKHIAMSLFALMSVVAPATMAAEAKDARHSVTLPEVVINSDESALVDADREIPAQGEEAIYDIEDDLQLYRIPERTADLIKRLLEANRGDDIATL